MLVRKYRKARHQWSCGHRNWTLKKCLQVYLSDEGRFIIHHIDGRMRVWRPPNTAYRKHHLVGTAAIGGGVWQFGDIFYTKLTFMFWSGV